VAKSLTARLGLQRWSADSDTQSRSEFDNDAAQLESLVAKAAHGAIGARPAAAAAWADSFFLITDATGGGTVGMLYYCDGATWTPFHSTALVDAKGDLLVGSADNTVVRKAVGADGTVLTADAASAGGVKWASAAPVAHAARAVPTSAQSIPNATYTAVAFASETLDTDNFHDNATNNTRLTVPTGLGGKYKVCGHFIFAGATGGDRSGRIYKNGANSNQSLDQHPASSNFVAVHPELVLSLAAGDYVELFVYQDSGAALSLAGATGEYASLELVYLGT
jgi:hypothetical protein